MVETQGKSPTTGKANMKRQETYKKRIRSGDSSIRRSYNAVKTHFMQRLEAFDKILAEHERAQASVKEEQENPVKIKPAFYDLVQEGIGTMIMHLPRELAVQTLGDFTAILSSNLKRQKSKKVGEDNTTEAARVIEELENVKNHVIENNHIDEVFVEPLLVAIAEMNGDKPPLEKEQELPEQPSKDEQKEHEEMDRESRVATPDAQYRQVNDSQLDEFTLIKGTNALELSEMNG